MNNALSRGCPQSRASSTAAPGRAVARIRSDGADCHRSGMTRHRSRLHINHPGALIAAIPAVLGFTPEHSWSWCRSTPASWAAVLRVDLSPELAEGLHDLVEVMDAEQPDAVIAVIVDDTGAACPMCNEEYRALWRSLTDASRPRHPGLGRACRRSHRCRRAMALRRRLRCPRACRRSQGFPDGGGCRAGRAPPLRHPRRSAGRDRRRPNPSARRPPCTHVIGAHVDSDADEDRRDADVRA